MALACATPLTRIKRHLYRQSLAIFGSAALALVLAGGVWLGVQTVLDHERANLSADFAASVAYIAEQEQFLRKVQAQAARAPHSPGLAAHLHDYYTLFWAHSPYPSASLSVFDGAGTVRLTIPPVSDTAARPGSGEVNAALLENIVATTLAYGETAGETAAHPVPNRLHWLALPGEPRRMVGVLPVMGDRASTLWLATLMSRARLQGQADTTVLDKHDFWLTRGDGGVLLGQSPLPDLADGFSLTAQGLALCLTSERVGQQVEQPRWHGCYRIGYGSFFEDKLWLPAVTLLLVLAGILGGRGYLRWFQRQVIDPAQHTQQQLAAANEAKSTFLATMSHEIRTPLYGVLGTLELLAATPLTPQQQQYVARMQGAATLLQQQISDVLDLRTIEAGQLRINPAPFDVRELVQTTTDAYLDMASRKGVLLQCDIAPDAPDWVSGDAARLRQILANLLSNALKFTDTGSVTVRLEGAPTVPLRLTVTDTGAGMAPEQLSTLFTPFQTAHNPGGIQGAGLGLSISQHLAQLMGSRIEVASTPGAGSRFSLTLALPTVPKPAPKPESAQQPTDTAAPSLALRVLVAEDNPINQATLQAQLQQLGCTVTLAADGEAALARWQAQADSDAPFDVLLTDVNMPKLDGYALARTLRERGVAQPIIGVTANALADEAARCRAAGMTTRLLKPVTLTVLAEVLGEAVPSEAARRPSAPASLPPVGEDATTIPTHFRAVFVTTMRADLTAWREHLAAGDAARLAQTLHRIRGGLVAVGQTGLADRLAGVETILVRDGLTEAIRAELRDADTILQILIDANESLLDSLL